VARSKPGDFNAQIRALRTVLRRLRGKLTQLEVANRAGLDITTVGGRERGPGKPDYITLCRILEALGRSWTEFGLELDRELAIELGRSARVSPSPR
jgi:transcriptional regulator with XRE-family HTH domain